MVPPAASVPPPRFARCPGTLGRRAFVRSGLVGWGALSLAELFRRQAQAAPESAPASDSNKSLIMLWLWGGPSHLETFDLKPQAPREYRGDFRPIATNVSGIEISEHLPRLARLADRYVLIRSLHHDSPGHVNSTHTLLTGYPGELVEAPPYRPRHPDFYSVVQHELGPRVAGAPAFVGMPLTRYLGSAYLGTGYDPLLVAGNPAAPEFRVPGLAISAADQLRLTTRRDLARRFDHFREDLDQGAVLASFDRAQERAAAILTSGAMEAAFCLDREPTELRERYGMDEVGQRCLLARRLVEAGCRLVSIDFPCVPGQKAFSWDDHASVWNIFDEMRVRLPVLDRVVSALIEDLAARGLDRDVLLVVMGEMSHTPRLSNHQGQPGREHWGGAMSLLMAGGGMPMGQVIGSTNPRGEEPATRPVSPGDLQATWYRYLGVPVDRAYLDFQGRPTPLVPQGQPLAELI